MRLFKRRHKEPTDTEWIDTDRDSVPLGDDDDVTSLMFTLTMQHGTMNVTWDDKAGVWMAQTQGRTWHGVTQREALERCKADLG